MDGYSDLEAPQVTYPPAKLGDCRSSGLVERLPLHYAEIDGEQGVYFTIDNWRCLKIIQDGGAAEANKQLVVGYEYGATQ